LPANALAQQCDDLDRDLRLPLEKGEEVFAPQHEQFAGFARGRVRGAALAIQYRDLAEQIARAHEVECQPAAVGGPGLDADLAAAHAEQRVARITLLEQHFAIPQMLGVAEIGQSLQFVRAEISEHRVHFQDDRKFGLLAHFNVLVNFPDQCPWPISLINFLVISLADRRDAPTSASRKTAPGKCAISHITLQLPRTIFAHLERVPVRG
jgi:hypothetical protein